MITLFALTKDPSDRILKLSLDQSLKKEVKDLFLKGKYNFLDGVINHVDFDGKYKPEDNELLKINDFIDIDGIFNAVSNPRSINDFIPNVSTLFQTKAIFTCLDPASTNKEILIQYFDKRKILSTVGLSIFHDKNTYKKVDGHGITIDENLTAILTEDSLIFKSFHWARRVFDLSDYYKEATDTDIKAFSQLSTIDIPDLKKFIDIADSWMRRKINLIGQSQILTMVPLHIIESVAKEYKIDINVVNQKIQINADKKKAKELFRLLDEDYYKSPLSQQYYLTNSKKPKD